MKTTAKVTPLLPCPETHDQVLRRFVVAAAKGYWQRRKSAGSKSPVAVALRELRVRSFALTLPGGVDNGFRSSMPSPIMPPNMIAASSCFEPDFFE